MTVSTTQISFTPSKELYPFESRWFDSSAGKIHFIDEGQGPPILFCHGNPTWSFLYRNIITALRGQFRCVAMDYPGFGLSVRPSDYRYTPAEHARVVTELVAHLNLKNLVIMGQDWGGPIGLATALADPPGVRGFVFGNTWFWPSPFLRNRIFSLVMSTPWMQHKILEENFFVEKLIPGGITRSLSPLEMNHYRGVQPTPAARRGVAEFPRQIRKAGPWLKEIGRGMQTELSGKPLLLTWGVGDVGFRPSYIRRWKQMFANHQVVLLPGARHFIQEDSAAEIAAAITSRFG